MPTLGTTSAATGVISMVLLTAVVVLGILLDRRVRLPGLPRFAGLSLHRYCSLLTVVFLGLHIAGAVGGQYARIGLAAVVVPFASPYARGWLALGTIATDLIVAIVLTSLLRRHLQLPDLADGALGWLRLLAGSACAQLRHWRRHALRPTA